MFLLDFYEIPPLKKPFNFFSNLIIFIILAGSLAAVYFYILSLPGVTPKTILFLDVLIFSSFLIFWRFLISKGLEFLGVKEKIILIGNCPGLSEKEIDRGGFRLIKKFGLDSLKVSELKKWAKKADALVYDFEFLEKEKLVKDVFQELPLKVSFKSFPEFYEEILGKVPLNSINEAWFLTQFSRPEKRIEEIIKRVFDIFFAILGLTIGALLAPFIVLLIKLDSPGPVFYCQKRVGKGRKIFTICKFRTMTHTPEADKKVWREKEKGQVTRVGKFLRATLLDEIPQFWNILKGELSFVGPRPEWIKLAEIFEKEIPFYSQRYLIKPGLTGWAQINYPASTSVEEAREKFEYDLYYIKNRSFLLDLGIIFKTLRIVIRDFFRLS